MARTLIYRDNRFFKIDESQLPAKAKASSITNALYADIYVEFVDAQLNQKYSNMDLKQRMQAVNDFARKWLQDKGFA
jgi:hypothetical protein